MGNAGLVSTLFLKLNDFLSIFFFAPIYPFLQCASDRASAIIIFTCQFFFDIPAVADFTSLPLILFAIWLGPGSCTRFLE
jgi:hypothetical protein